MDELKGLALGAPPWRQLLLRGGRCELDGDVLRLVTAGATRQAYVDAQIDDFQVGQAQRFIRRPPLRLQVRARFSHPAGALRGTAGFGFWNYPIAAPPRPPQAVWFFYSSAPGDLPLALGVPGQGWKAAVIDAGRPQALALLPLAPILVPLLNLPALYRGLYPPLQRAVGVAETLVRVPLEQWHDYGIEWGERTSRFLVDGRVVLDEAPSPRGPLCFVAWLDNQYLVVTPQGRVRWGLLDAPEQQYLAISAFNLAAP